LKAILEYDKFRKMRILKEQKTAEKRAESYAKLAQLKHKKKR